MCSDYGQELCEVEVLVSDRDSVREGREKNQRHSTKNKLMTALPARDRGLDSLAYRICFGI